MNWCSCRIVIPKQSSLWPQCVRAPIVRLAISNNKIADSSEKPYWVLCRLSASTGSILRLTLLTCTITLSGDTMYHVGIPPPPSMELTLTVTALIWTSVHLPFVMSFLLAAAALSRIVLAHDRNEADLETLSEAYLGRSVGEISSGLRWFYCTGLGIALACMGKIYRPVFITLLATLAHALRRHLGMPRAQRS